MTDIISAPIDSEAVLAVLGPWETAKLDQLARKVIYRLSRRPAVGLFAEYSHSSLWGEYAHHVQMGDFEGVSDHLDDLAKEICETVAEAIPPHDMALFDHLAEAYGDPSAPVGVAYLVRQLSELVSERASQRDLERYSDDYRWYENL